MTPLTLALIILLAPVAGLVFLTFAGRQLSFSGGWPAVAILGITFAAALALFAGVFAAPQQVLHYSLDWIRLGGDRVLRLGFLVDNLTRTMLLVVTGVSFFVHLYSTAYMKGDARYQRYFAGLQLFTFSMLGLVLADNFLMLYIFWELVGLSSYLLIGHYFEKPSAAKACIKAFLTTRIGDVGMFLGILIIWHHVGSLDYATVFAAANPLASAGADGAAGIASERTLTGLWKTLAGLGIFFGAMGKSAQFPLHVWLPDAMEGPTPVSAMIHAATMVAAGVYLVGRVYPLFDPIVLVTIALIGGITAIFAATIALVQDDIKRVLAYSTVSQLGYMMLGLGAGSFVAGLFHMTTHAAFKALLFLGSGSVIYAMHHEQSMSRYGGLRKKLPITFATFLIATLAISGLPFLTSGFYSKDMIIAKTLEAALLNFNNAAMLYWILFVVAVLTAALTTFYMFRAVFLTFYGEPRDPKRHEHAKESPRAMTIPLVALAVFSIIAGGFAVTGTTWFENRVNPDSSLYRPYLPAEAGAEHAAHVAHVAHTAHWVTIAATVCMFLLGLGLAWLMYIRGGISPARIAGRFAPLHRLFNAKWYVDEFYDATILRANRALYLALDWVDRTVVDSLVNLWGWTAAGIAFLSGAFDRRIVDGVVNLVGRETQLFGYVLGVFQTGRVRHYLLYSISALSIFAMVFYMIF